MVSSGRGRLRDSLVVLDENIAWRFERTRRRSAVLTRPRASPRLATAAASARPASRSLEMPLYAPPPPVQPSCQGRLPPGPPPPGRLLNIPGSPRSHAPLPLVRGAVTHVHEVSLVFVAPPGRGHPRAMGRLRTARPRLPHGRRRRGGDRALPDDPRPRARSSRPGVSSSTRAIASRAASGSTSRGSPEHRMWIQHQFHQYVPPRGRPRHPARLPHRGDQASGPPAPPSARSTPPRSSAASRTSSTRALPMSGTFNLMRFTEATHPTDYYRVSSPLHFVPHLEGRHLDVLRTRLHPHRHGRGEIREHRRELGARERARREGDPQPGRLVGPRLVARLGHLACHDAEVPGRVDEVRGRGNGLIAGAASAQASRR